MFFSVCNKKQIRWFNHISAASEAYKQRTKSQNHEMTPIEDPASVTIPPSVTLAKETTDHEFVTSGTANNSLNTSTSNANAADSTVHSQFAQDGQKDTGARHNNSTSSDGDAFSK